MQQCTGDLMLGAQKRVQNPLDGRPQYGGNVPLTAIRMRAATALLLRCCELRYVNAVHSSIRHPIRKIFSRPLQVALQPETAARPSPALDPVNSFN
jgi:hypothetical protein